MITATARAARTAAAFSILADVERERVTVDERGTPYKDRIVLPMRQRVRVTMLAMILLDCFGYEDVERDAILKLDASRLFKKDMAWLREHLKDGAISGVIRDFMELQKAFA
jgi:hypothetical protein